MNKLDVKSCIFYFLNSKPSLFYCRHSAIPSIPSLVSQLHACLVSYTIYANLLLAILLFSPYLNDLYTLCPLSYDLSENFSYWLGHESQVVGGEVPSDNIRWTTVNRLCRISSLEPNQQYFQGMLEVICWHFILEPIDNDVIC